MAWQRKPSLYVWLAQFLCLALICSPALLVAHEGTDPVDKLSITPIREIHSKAQEWGENHQVRVRGIVTHVMSDSSFYFRDDTGGMYAYHKPKPAFRVGEQIELTGHLALAGYSPILENCSAVSMGMGDSPEPIATAASEVLSGKHDLQLVTLQGRLSAERLRRGGVLVLRDVDSSATFAANLEAIPLSGFPPFDALQADSVLEVSGACRVTAGGDGTPRSITLFLQSFDDVQVVSGPPWWNRERAQLFLIVTATGLGLSIAWSVSLRKLVASKTNALQEQLQKERRLEHRYRALFESNPHPTWAFDLESLQFLAVNDAAVAHYGWSREEFSGMTIRDIRPFEDVPSLEQPVPLAKHPLNEPGLQRHRKKGGELFDAEVTSHTIDFDGRQAAVVLATDVTERLRAETELRASQEQFATVFRGNPDAIIIVRAADERIVNVNPAFENLFEWSRVDVIGRTTNDLYIWAHPEERSLAIAELQETRTLRNLEREFQTKTGHRFFGLSSAQVITYDGELCFLSLTRDITDRKQADAALQETRDRLNAVLSSLDDAVWSTGPDGQPLLYANRAAEIIYGCNAAEFNPMGGSTIQRICSEDRACILTLPDRLRTVDAISEEFRIERGDEGTRWLRMRSRLMRDATGKAVRIDGITSDITAFKAAEEERRQFDSQLQQTQKLESLGVLAGGIAHDFNNLLTAVIGYLTLSRMELSQESLAFRYLAEAENASQRAADLARQMLAYSGRGKFVAQRVNLREVVDDMSQILMVSISKDAELRATHARKVPAIEVDVTQLRQIILNFVINASDALGQAGGVITISTGAMDCDQELLSSTWLKTSLNPGTYCFLDVADNGCGIEKEKLARIFDPFFTTKFTGRGLGLSAVLGIVRGHQGAIDVKSDPGKWTSFKVLFPASNQPAQILNAPAPSIAVAWHGHGLVLLVDDDPSILQVGKHMLEWIGFDVVTAADGWEAVRIYRERPDEIQLVLLDLTMPNLDGQETLRELQSIRMDVPVILSSGYTEHDVMQRLAGSAFSGFVAKPYSLTNLQSVLQTVLQRATALDPADTLS